MYFCASIKQSTAFYMLKKLDKLVLGAFIGPFALTYMVSVFVLLMQVLVEKFKDFIGKGLDLWVFVKLLALFSFNVTPIALPLAMLLASIMSFGNLGQHNELTAVKSTGISLLRVLRPIGILAILISISAFWFNNSVVPYANLEVYSLAWDIKKTKPTLEFEEGVFYKGIPGYSIRIEKKSGEDGADLHGVFISGHNKGRGNTDEIQAQTGRMYSTKIDQIDFLVLELQNGSRWADLAAEGTALGNDQDQDNPFLRTNFQNARFAFNLQGLFGMDTTDKELFKDHPYMKNVSQLASSRDSLLAIADTVFNENLRQAQEMFLFEFLSRNPQDHQKKRVEIKADSLHKAHLEI